MEMSIDEAIEILSQSAVVIGAENWQVARHCAIDTMRKYQKIEQIINYPVYIQEDVLRYKMICEVVGKKNITHGTYEGENRGGN